ncbi:MAG: response regulator, partial [Magnetococcales bacterium]|nr:response regulator [Magnetococcales bacterium]
MKRSFLTSKRLLIPALLVTLPVLVVTGTALFLAHLETQRDLYILMSISLLVIALAGCIGWLHERSMSADLKNLSEALTHIASGEMNARVQLTSVDEIRQLGYAFNKMVARMENQSRLQARNLWLTDGMAALHKCLGENDDLLQLCTSAITVITTHLEAAVGGMYIINEDGSLSLKATHAHHKRRSQNNRIFPGEGVVGQALLEKKYFIINQLPKTYLLVRSGLGEIAPQEILVFPFLLHGTVKGIIELGTLTHFTDTQITFLQSVTESMAMAIAAAQSHARTTETLAQLSAQSQKLKDASHALRQSNATLEEQKQALQLSQAQLLEQQEELRVSNEELEEQAQLLEEQKHEADRRNVELLSAQEVLQRQTKDLQMANRYKSEFLSNMSHELRTPLNSLLILAKSFMDNEDGNLHEQQVEDARIIHSSGSDLLRLINDILDLSKIEAGRMGLTSDLLDLPSFASDLTHHFSSLAAEKGLTLTLECSSTKNWQPFRTDGEKLRRILKNLLANAIKFTKQGSVTLSLINVSKDEVAFAVTDTGIGIPEEKRCVIFEAFQQADGSTSRSFGGIGLGLNLSTNLAHLLGGTIHVESEEGKGSCFTLTLSPLPKSSDEPEIAPKKPVVPQLQPPLNLPSRFTHDEPCNLLLVEDDANARTAMIRLLQNQPVQVTEAATGSEALTHLQARMFDCVILDLGLPDIDGCELLELFAKKTTQSKIPIIVHSGRDLSRETYDQIKKHTDSIVVKGKNAPVRLLDEMAMLLCQTETAAPSLPVDVQETTEE